MSKRVTVADDPNAPATIWTGGPNGLPKVIHTREDCWRAERSKHGPHEHPADSFPEDRVKRCPNCWGETDE